MTRAQDLKRWEELRKNPPENWRDTWALRQKVFRTDTEEDALLYVKVNREFNEQELKVDLHPKDGFVIYYDLGGKES